MSDDGVHPNLYGNCSPQCLSGDFSDEGLRYGFNQRNFTALQVLDKLWRVVINDGTPDPSPAPAPTGNLSIVVTPRAPSAGGPLVIEVIVQPVQQPFDAWGIVGTPRGKVYSFVLGDESKLVSGLKPLARDVPGLRAALQRRLFSCSAIPPDDTGAFTVTVGLVPAGTVPRSPGSAIPGYVDQTRIDIVR